MQQLHAIAEPTKALRGYNKQMFPEQLTLFEAD